MKRGEEEIERLGTGRVLCVGDVMLDRYVEGGVSRLSPEAPIPVLEVGTSREMLGGSGNVVNNLCGLGCEVLHVSVVGDDEAGEEIFRKLEALGLQKSCLRREAGRKTTTKTRFRSGTQQILRVDEEECEALSAESVLWLQDCVKELLEGCGVLVLSDYGKGVLWGGVAGELIREAKFCGVKVVVDPKGNGFYGGADVLTPNRGELREATGYGCEDREGVVEAARVLMREGDVGGVLATLSEEGMIWVDGDGYHEIRDEVREVYDVAGAGDTVLAVFSAGLAGGLSPFRSACLANKAASVVVGKAGTARVSLSELRGGGFDSCVSGDERLSVRWEEWRSRGLVVGFANGCFDILHAGHVRMLRSAREFCDRLVVGLNSDLSVKMLKGEGRPVNSLQRRMEVVGSLGCVDGVLSFEEETPLRKIVLHRPHIVFKGGDYREEDVVGYEEVKEWGGRIEILPLEEGISTTKLIEDLKR
jgi:D-beta-D-heptose 7-phosphate kinase/D-beta-D-heptose 1-phosphate adenosyltransferase